MQKGSKICAVYDLLWFTKPLVIKFRGIAGYIEDYD